ncbi:hypothetical protein AB1Y20_016959 [Prymnesium parvum]|uniref:Sulfotransferase domain-containing protein n=1 Tax=Prymnesium parvum TaxID=97485 RepID=A0AB34ICM2_PRYPA
MGAAAPRLTFWVITPELRTDEVVLALRSSWLREVAVRTRFCVAAGLSSSADASLRWLPRLNRSQSVASGRHELNERLHDAVTHNPDDELFDRPTRRADEPLRAQQRRENRTRELTRLYNNFLRYKVFEMMRAMCAEAREDAFDYAFMMDADTAVNTSNLQRFVGALGGERQIYTGLCRKRSWGKPNGQRGVGGGPGILFSRKLLLNVCPRLELCSPLRGLMDRLERAGGDLMIAKCFEFLGVRCQLVEELPLDGKAVQLEDLFRRGPPWVYPPLPGGTILVASHLMGAKAIEQHQRLANGHLPNTEVISFHRVRPSLRAQGWDRDPRCRIYAEYTRLETGPVNWFSRCLPHFLVVGTPKSGTTSLFNWIMQHPDARAPARKELHAWTPVLQPDRSCADRPGCAVFNPKRRGMGPAWPISKQVAGKMLDAYLANFPRIDPREFALTGEATPAYVYSPSALMLLQSALMSHTHILLLLRDPAERAFSEFKNKRDLMLKGAARAHVWIDGHADFSNFTRALSVRVRGCTAEELYQACVACRRFAAAPFSGAPPGGAPLSQPRLDAPGAAELTAARRRCYAPPVIWQSWYHLFLPPWLALGRRLLLEFSDDAFADADGLMRRVAAFLSLPAHNFSTRIAYNTETKRGAFIGKDVGERNAALAALAMKQRSKASAGAMGEVERLVVDSVRRFDAQLKTAKWTPPPQQLRRELPQAWRERYRLT